MIISGPDNLTRFLKSRDSFSLVKNKNIEFKILDKDPRGISLNNDLTSITISAKEIGDLKNYYNQVGLLQAFYRFLGFQTIKDDIFLLHGSAVVYKGKTILFADNGRSIGKTLSSLELAHLSNQYIADEFIFIDTNLLEIFSDDDIPIHFRQEVRNHFSQHHDIVVAEEFILKEVLNCEFIKQKKLDFIVYTNFSKDKEGVVKLPSEIAKKYAITTLTAHLEKMLNPALDRFQFIAQQDMGNMGDSHETMIKQKEIFQKLQQHLLSASEKIIRAVPSFELFVKTPCSIPSYCDTIVNNNV
jgi:hypothetical protein